MTLAISRWRRRNLSGDCRVFVRSKTKTRQRFSQWILLLTPNLAGLSGFYRGERGAEKSVLAEISSIVLEIIELLGLE
jgi:hypothetical protein